MWLDWWTEKQKGRLELPLRGYHQNVFSPNAYCCLSVKNARAYNTTVGCKTKSPDENVNFITDTFGWTC